MAFAEWTSINSLEIWSNKFKCSVWVSNHGWMCLAEYARSIVLRQYLYLEGLCVPKMPKYGDKFQATHPFGRKFRHCVPWHFQRSSSNGKKWELVRLLKMKWINFHYVKHSIFMSTHEYIHKHGTKWNDTNIHTMPTKVRVLYTSSEFTH